MKILIITQKYDTNDPNLGVFIDWWDRLALKFQKIYILALEKRSEPTISNMEVISMGKEKGIGFFKKILGFYTGLFKTIGKTEAILVHMIPKYVLLAAPVAFFYRKPIYMWYTGVSVHWQLRLAVVFCKKVFTAHPAAMRIDTPKRIVTGHGIDVNKFFPLCGIPHSGTIFSNEITVLSVGRITPSKGHDFVINAIADLIKSGYNLKLKIIGGVIQNYHKKYLESLKELMKNLQIEKNIEFLGPVSYKDIPIYFQEADILINAVPFGGLDKVTLEAMASGVIPLTSNSAFLTVFPEHIAKNFVFEDKHLEDLEVKLKYVLEKKIYQDKTLLGELRNVVVKNHNLDNLISKIAAEMAL
ncbi:MAG: glycosyltransferase family 4 protein [Candidatus Azambacteria bacterium]|nr:glycosyltransferase family 4 protein [Candidatus Azambacteria bacterium]